MRAPSATRTLSLPWLAFVAGCGAAVEPAPPPASTASPPAAHFDAGEASSAHLPANVKPVDYRLELAVDPRLPTFSGLATIQVSVKEATDHIVLHGRDLAVESLTVSRGDELVKGGVHMRKGFGAKTTEEEMVLHLERTIDAGQWQIEIAYEAPFGTLLGLYRVDQGDESYAFTQLESTYARRMFPSFDEPRHKTPFSIELIVPNEMRAFANTKLREMVKEPDGKNSRYLFNKTEPLPTYLVAIAVGKLEHVPGPQDPTSIGLIATPQGKAQGAQALDAARASLVSLEKYFGRKYPYDKLDVAAVPNFAPGAMENAGLVTFREELLLLPPGSPRRAERHMQSVMAHELAHQWFGNLVTMQWWDDLWLNEGFATWMTGKVCDEAFPGFDSATERLLGKDLAMRFDALPAARAVRQNVVLHDQIRETGGWSAYQKGSAVLSMLEAWTGPAVFQQGIVSYVNAQADKSITSEELFASLEQVSKKPIGKVAKSVLDKSGVPLIEMIVGACNKKDKSRTVDLTTFSLGGPAGAEYVIPVCVRPEAGAPVCTLLEGGRGKISLPNCPAYVVPNADERGYYRYDLDDPGFAAVLGKINELPSVERAGVLVNTWALVLAGRRGSADALRALLAVDWKKETSRGVLDAALLVLEEMEQTLVGTKDRAAFAKLVNRVLGPTHKRLGLSPRAGEPPADTLMRASLAGALFELADDTSLAKRLAEPARRHLAQGGGPDALGADLAVEALRMLAATGQGVTVADLEAAKTSQHRVAVTKALARRRDKPGLVEALSLVQSGNIRSGDFRYLRNGAMERPETRAIFYEWATTNLDAVGEKVGGAGALIASLSYACGDEPAALAFERSVAQKLSSLESSQRAFEEGQGARERCGRLQKSEGDAFRKALSGVKP